MKFRKYFNNKNFSKILAFWILLSNIHINSLASILSNDSRYETFEGSRVRIEDILEEDEVNVEVDGNTLVNILDNVEWEAKSTYLYNNSLKYNISGKTLTIINFADKDLDLTLNSGNVEKFEGVYSRSITIPKKSFIVEKISNDECFRTFVAHTSSGWVQSSDSKNLMNKLVVLDGDYTNRLLPEKYFEGMKSIGQDDINGHNVKFLSSNKNLWNIDEVKKQNGEKPAYTKEGNTITYSHVGEYGIYVPIRVKKGQTLRISGVVKNVHNIRIFKESDNFVGMGVYNIYYEGRETEVSPNYAYTFSEDGIYHVRVWCQNIGTAIFKNFLVEISDKNTTYIEKSTIEKSVKLNEPLRGLPSGVRDRVVYKNGNWFIERNCYQINLKDYKNLKISLGGESTETHLVGYMSWDSLESQGFPRGKDDIIASTPSSNILSNNFSVTRKTLLYHNDGIGSDKNGINISISREILGIDENNNALDVLLRYLIENDCSFIYQLNEPIYENIENFNILSHKDVTYIQLNSSIATNIRVTVDRVANRAKEYSELVKSNPSSENISLARMWSNLMKESLLKDRFQSDINNIIKIDDLSLEKKYSSSNIDLYIKSKNSLVMSLNTNSIIFEGFSGVEDDIKEKAVNISVSSSLPYQLNAYLATGIQNSDSSNTINKLILNIKESGQTEYKTFNALNDKVVLKDSCESGNNKQHNIDLKLNAGIAHEKDAYKTTIQFEAEQI